MCSNHPQSIFCILPPQILTNLARNGNAEEREFALDALSLDHTLRTTRLTYAMAGGLKVPHPAASLPPPQEKRSIYDAGRTHDLPGTLARSEGQAAVPDHAVNQAYDGLGDTFNFYLNVYDRNSIDNAGMPLVASVHFSKKYDNAFWNGQ